MYTNNVCLFVCVHGCVGACVCVCVQVIVWYHYLTHLQQENNCYSICTVQISEAVQFIRANYWYKVLEVISPRHILHSFRHRPSALLWIRVLPARLHNGLTVPARHWVVRLSDNAWRLPDWTADDFSQGHWSQMSDEIQLKKWCENRSAARGDQAMAELAAVGAGRVHAAAPGLLGSVCLSCFVIPSNWPSLHPTLPYQGLARGETDHGGGRYALVSLNYTTLGPWPILAQSITANVSNVTDAHGGITTNIVRLTFSQGCVRPVREAQAQSSAHDGSHSAVIVFHSVVLSIY